MATQTNPSPSLVPPVVRMIVIRTVIAVTASVVLTSLIMFVVIGADGSKIIPIAIFWRMGLAMSVLVPLIICPIMFIQLQRVILALHDAQDALAYAAKTDALTGLWNRRGFDHAALQAFADAGRAQMPIAVLMCDIDFFKTINDTYGHDFGDTALIDVAEVIRSSLGNAHAVIGRHGGEEFIVLLPGLGATEARDVAEHVCSACGTKIFHGEGHAATITLSIGIAVAFANRSTLRELISRADAGLFQAKRGGRNRVVFNEEMVAGIA